MHSCSHIVAHRSHTSQCNWRAAQFRSTPHGALSVKKLAFVFDVVDAFYQERESHITYRIVSSCSFYVTHSHTHKRSTQCARNQTSTTATNTTVAWSAAAMAVAAATLNLTRHSQAGSTWRWTAPAGPSTGACRPACGLCGAFGCWRR